MQVANVWCQHTHMPRRSSPAAQHCQGLAAPRAAAQEAHAPDGEHATGSFTCGTTAAARAAAVQLVDGWGCAIT
jgi:hypothetical protein